MSDPSGTEGASGWHQRMKTYEGRDRCEWRLRAEPDGYMLRYRFVIFDLEANDECPYASIIIINKFVKL